jgi:uncharacterized protein (TIGR02328 family)
MLQCRDYYDTILLVSKFDTIGVDEMRLWSQQLITKLPRQQLLGQHRECSALRGNGWGKKHATVNYVFNYNPAKLVAYHKLIMLEMINRGYKVNPLWTEWDYRGKICERWNASEIKYGLDNTSTIYPEHDNNYLQECLDNLKGKGISITI